MDREVRLCGVATSKCTCTARSTMAELKFLVEARLAPAIIGRGGSAVKRIKIESQVTQVHLSQNAPGVVERTVSLQGPAESINKAFDLITEVLRAEAGLSAGDAERARLLVPDADLLVGEAAIRRVREASSAQIESAAAQGSTGRAKERHVSCTGSVQQVASAVHRFVGAIAERQSHRHRDFLARWAFETAYSDHFETPQEAYADILPLLQSIAQRRARKQLKRKRGGAGYDEYVKRAAVVKRTARENLRGLAVYDPYYCQGAVRDALGALGLDRTRVVNENRDFYADVDGGTVPAHDVLVTNPPYSGEHKQRLLAYLRGEHEREHCRASRPFMLLMPAWLAATDYWADFVEQLAHHRHYGHGGNGPCGPHPQA